MTSAKQNKTVTTDAVELNDAALDRASGGGTGREELYYTITLTKGSVAPGDGSVKTIKDTI